MTTGPSKVNPEVSDFITILTTAETGRVLTKRHTPDGVVDFDGGAWFTSREVSIASLDDLAAALECPSDSCVILGKIKPGVDPTEPHRRLLIDKPDAPASYDPAAHRYLLLDVDEKAPRGADGKPDESYVLTPRGWVGDIPGTMRRVLCDWLPPELRGVTFKWRLTGSAGIKPGVHVRLAFMLDRAVTTDELTAWFANFPNVDKAAFRPVQPIYCAAPIFEGVLDPVKQRSGGFSGNAFVAMPADLAERVAARKQREIETGWQQGSPIDLADLKKMFAALDPPDDYETIKRIAAAAADANCPDDPDMSERLDLFMAWNARGIVDDHDGEERHFERLFWDMAHPGKVHVGTLIQSAQDMGGYVPPSQIPEPDGRADTFDAYVTAESERQKEDDGGPQIINTAEKYDDHRVTAGWTSYGDEEVDDTPTPEIVPRWVEKGVAGYDEGGGGLGKSYIATQDGLCIAAGYPVLGERAERTDCWYLNYEEPKGEFGRRVARIRRNLGSRDPVDGHLLPAAEHKLLDARRFKVRHLRDEPAAHILRVTKDGAIIITRFGRTFLADLAARRGLHTFIVFDGIMDAILFEGSTRMDDSIARQVIALLDRWCVEYNFTARAILHPSRAGERQGGGSYAPAWSTKPRVIHAYSLVTFDGKPIGNRKDIPAAHLFTRRYVEKRSHGVSKYWVDVQYRDGVFEPAVRGVACGGEDPVAVAVDLACKQAERDSRIKQDGKIGAAGAALNNKHGVIIEYRRRTGQQIGADHFLGALKEALAKGLIAYQAGGSGGNGRKPAGYYPIAGWAPAENVYEAWQDDVTLH